MKKGKTKYHSKRKAQLQATLETIRTGINHHVILMHTWRNLIPRKCWGIKILEDGK